MLTRIISGAVGVVLLTAVLWFHDTLALPIAVSVIIMIMLYELIRAVNLHKCIPVLIASEICGMSMPFVYRNKYLHTSIIDENNNISGSMLIKGNASVYAFCLTMLAAAVIFIIWLKKHKEIRYEQIFFVLAVTVLVPQAMTTMIKIERLSEKEGLFLLIMGLCGAWIADTGAYFSGVALGKHKLCPEISPKKTIEGFIGGILITGVVFSVAFSLYLEFSVMTMILSFVMGIISAIVGTVGDLSASMVKRQIGFKDYGKIMPGHGGLMDRFDSVLFVLPAFYAFLSFLLTR